MQTKYLKTWKKINEKKIATKTPFLHLLFLLAQTITYF